MIAIADILYRVHQETGAFVRTMGRGDEPARGTRREGTDNAHAHRLATTEYVEDQLRNYIRDGAIEIAKRTKRITFPTQVNVLAGVNQIWLPDDVDYVRAVRLRTLGEGAQVFALVRDDGLPVRLHATSTPVPVGRPTCFGVDAGWLWLDRATDTPCKVEIFSRSNTAAPVQAIPGAEQELSDHMPVEFEGAMVEYVLAMWFRSAGLDAMYRSRMESFNRLVEMYKTDPNFKRIARRPYRPY